MKTTNIIVLIVAGLLSVGCASTPVAPVVNRQDTEAKKEELARIREAQQRQAFNERSNIKGR